MISIFEPVPGSMSGMRHPLKQRRPVLLEPLAGEVGVTRVQLDQDGVTAHLLGHEGGRAGAAEGVEDGAGLRCWGEVITERVTPWLVDCPA